MTARDRLARLLVEARVVKQMTQEDVAAALGITSAQISRWERGTQVPNSNRVTKLCDVLGLDRVELLILMNEAGQEEVRTLRRDYEGIVKEVRALRDEGSELMATLRSLIERLESNARFLEASVSQPRETPPVRRRPAS